MRLGIDVGGTFTDLVLIDDDSGHIQFTKTLTTPGDLSAGVLNGVKKILDLAEVNMDRVDYIVHGTTIGTNALIERTGARVGLITTAGFRDVLEIARIERPDAGLYDINVDLPDPLVPRYLRLEAMERIGADGNVVTALEPESVKQAAEIFKQTGAESIAVCLLFSFRNPAHERQIREILQEKYPETPVSLSSDVAPEFREFERTSTTVINAYLLPVIQQYLNTLVAHLGERYGPVDIRVMQASGGAMTTESAKLRAVNMVNSGPAGGALASALFGELAGEKRVIGVDMGGTSFDVSLIVDGQPRVKSEGEFEGYPVKIPMMDVEGIGAGGGSIAWVDSGGALNVGPQSAGADPGPACYGRGGTQPTVTDANLLLGRLNPDYFLGAEMELHVDRAHEAIRRYVADPLNMTVEAAAEGIIRVVNANMVRGISVNSTQKGYDVRDFALLAFGGAGPLHAVELAQEIGIGRVIVPPFCSVFSAFGAVASDLRHDYVKTVALAQAEVTPEVLRAGLNELESQARALLAEEKVSPENIVLERAADIRYEGQSYELTIPIAASGNLVEADVAATIDEFHKWHERVYAYKDPTEPVEFVSLRLTAIGRVPVVQLRRESAGEFTGAPAKGERKVHFPLTGPVTTKVFERNDLSTGSQFTGPCLIEETTSTTVIPPGWNGRVDSVGNIVITRE